MPRPIIYSRPGCVQCDLTKKLMKREGIGYDEINVEVDAEALELIVGMGYMQAPVIIYGEEHWSGFIPGRVLGLPRHDGNP